MVKKEKSENFFKKKIKEIKSKYLTWWILTTWISSQSGVSEQFTAVKKELNAPMVVYILSILKSWRSPENRLLAYDVASDNDALTKSVIVQTKQKHQSCEQK